MHFDYCLPNSSLQRCMAPIRLRLLFLILSLLAAVGNGSDITTFEDEKCEKSYEALETSNGYPDGLCTQLGIINNIKAFQIVELDPGCAVTLYGSNSGPLECSSETKIIGEIGKCYNSSWIYFSIDSCLPPASTSLEPKTLPTQSSDAKPQKSKKTNKGAIIGGTLGGVFGLALIVLAAIMFLRRRKKERAREAESHQMTELSGHPAAQEISPPEKVVLAEMGTNHAEEPPAELAGDAITGQDNKSMKPILAAHTRD